MTTISFDQLANIGIYAPPGATGFHTEAGKAVFLVGSTGQFVERALSTDAAERLMALYKIGGTLGWEITGAGATQTVKEGSKMELQNVVIYPDCPQHFCRLAAFAYEGRRYSAAIAIEGKGIGKSVLFVEGAPGDDCVTTHEVDEPELLAAIIEIANSR